MNTILSFKDWSPFDRPFPYEYSADLRGRPETNLGIHSDDKGNISAQGYIGITRLKNKDNEPITDENGEVILQITPRFRLDPWKMLDEVLADNDYITFITKNGQPDPDMLYKIFTNEKPVRIKTGQSNDSALMVAISFINLCHTLCTKQLKPRMTSAEENFNGKVRGKILIQKQLKKNVFQGREDRVYCRYGVFTIDCIENRILKAALSKAKIILNQSAASSGMEHIQKMMKYCFNALDGVSSTNITSSSFSQVRTNGFYSYYKPALELAKALILNMNISIEDSSADDKERYIIPFVIKMEALFELYCRVKINKMLAEYPEKNIRMIPCNKKFSVLSGGSKPHVMDNVIPDILLYDADNNCRYVYDAKYKRLDSTLSSRHDTHQLLSYVLLFQAKRCGFILPYEDTPRTAECKMLTDLDSLLSDENTVHTAKYDDPNSSPAPKDSECIYGTYLLSADK